jgi:hypothetical protein
LIATDERLLPVLAAPAVAVPVQIERVGWTHADRALNVLGSVARAAGTVIVLDRGVKAHVGIGRVAVRCWG